MHGKQEILMEQRERMSKRVVMLPASIGITYCFIYEMLARRLKTHFGLDFGLDFELDFGLDFG
jgi:hypothetical protein